MDEKPWYKQFWPWFIIALPATVVVAGLSTWYIAEKGADHLVAQEYYKEGLSINVELEKQQLAKELGLSAELRFDSRFVSVELKGPAEPTALSLELSHPLDEEQDLQLKLIREEAGLYRGSLPRSLEYRWHWQLEPLSATRDQTWRLYGEITIIPPDES